MAYTKTNWVDNTTPITASALNNIENGILYNDTYSTEEHIVGKWINNKPVYEKTIKVDVNSESATSQTLSHNITNIDTIWVDFGNTFYTWNGTTRLFAIASYENIDNMFGIVVVNKTTFEYTIPIWTINPTAQTAYVYVTLRYTKTTD